MNLMDLYLELDSHLLADAKPSDYLKEIEQDPLFDKYPFQMLRRLKFTEQSKKHHPEGNVWNHTILVLDEAARRKCKSKNRRVFMWAALLHDIGKPDTFQIRKGKITTYDHDKVGESLAKDFLSCFTDDFAFIKDVSGLVRYHMQIMFVAKNLSYADIANMKKNTDVEEIALLGLCDRLERTRIDREKEKQNIQLFLNSCK